MDLTDTQSKKLFLFTKLWCFSVLFHLASFHYWSEDYLFLFLVAFASGILHLVYPIKNYFFFTALITSVVLVFTKMPHIPNHILFEWFLNVMFLITSGIYCLYKQVKQKFENYFFDKTVLAARWSLVVLYFYVVLHKLNYDFHDAEISCGALLFEDIFNRAYLFHFDFIRDAFYHNWTFFANFSIYFTLIAEALIPILLISKKWRNVGLLFGMVFHLLLSLNSHNGIFSFSAMLFTAFIFFWNDKTTNHFYAIWFKYHSKIKIGLVGGVTLLIGLFLSNQMFYFNLVSLICWLLYGGLYLLIFFNSLGGIILTKDINSEKKYKVGWALIIPGLIFMNGAAPYLGLKTEASFSMFSNLRTEGNLTNHQFIPASTQIFDFQKNLVSVITTDDPRLQNLDLYHKEDDVQLVFFEFVKLLNSSPENVYVEFMYRDKVCFFEKKDGRVIRSDVSLEESRLLNKFLAFRVVHSDKALCRH